MTNSRGLDPRPALLPQGHELPERAGLGENRIEEEKVSRRNVRPVAAGERAPPPTKCLQLRVSSDDLALNGRRRGLTFPAVGTHRVRFTFHAYRRAVLE